MNPVFEFCVCFGLASMTVSAIFIAIQAFRISTWLEIIAIELRQD